VSKDIYPTDDEIKEMMTKEHKPWKQAPYRKVYNDRVTGGKMVRDYIKSKLTIGLKEGDKP